MSKGPGKLQRAILEALETKESVRLKSLLPEKYNQSEFSALYRAANKLRASGVILMRWQDRPETWGDRPSCTVRKRKPGEPAQVFDPSKREVLSLSDWTYLQSLRKKYRRYTVQDGYYLTGKPKYVLKRPARVL